MIDKNIIFRWLCLWVLVLTVWGAGPGLETAAAAERLTVKASIANMRSGPGTSHDVLWQVEKYHPFIVVEKKRQLGQDQGF